MVPQTELLKKTPLPEWLSAYIGFKRKVASKPLTCRLSDLRKLVKRCCASRISIIELTENAGLYRSAHTTGR
jgi:hypothetical protein